MPISSGAKGRTSVLASPSGGWNPRSGAMHMPLGGWTPIGHDGSDGRFRSAAFSTYNATVTGVTKDSTGAALASCVVQLFRTVDDVYLGETTSDGSGNYSIAPLVSGPFYLVAYKAGSPDVAGTTVNTLVSA